MIELPAWLDGLPDAAAQRALDEWAISQRGIPGLDLMERAGAGLARLTAELAPAGDSAIAVVCGKGNNGGDGLVAARLLREDGRAARVLLTGPEGELSGDARANLERLQGDPPSRLGADGLADADIVIDAVLGTGFTGTPHGAAAEAIAAINAARGHARVVACDVPSGVDASTGETAGTAVQADATATFHAAKPGLWIAPGKRHAGRVCVVDIGIPRRPGTAGDAAGLISERVLDLIPRRASGSNKFTAGSVLVCGGSPGLTGAPCLSARAAMRSGAGYVTLAGPASLGDVFEAKLLEVMTVRLPDEGGALGADAAQEALTRAARVQSVVLGPGLGRHLETAQFVRALVDHVETPLVLDADGLNVYAGALPELSGRRAATVLTPHAGELGRLLGRESDEVDAARLRSVTEAARLSRSIVVLKGDDTIVADPDGRVAINRGGVPALATAGTGDVLAGVIGSYLAKGVAPFAAACAGVFVHAAAGSLAASTHGREGVIASDVIEALARALDGAAG